MACATGANRHDSVVFDALVDALPAIAGTRGRPHRWPRKLHADKGDDHARCRAHFKRRGSKERIARKGIERNDRLGAHRWVVERTHAWLRTRFEGRITAMACRAAARTQMSGASSVARRNVNRVLDGRVIPSVPADEGTCLD